MDRAGRNTWAYNTGGRSHRGSRGAHALLEGFSLGFQEGVQKPGSLRLGTRQGNRFVLIAARQVGFVPGAEEILRSAYRAFNARDIEAAVQLMHPDTVSSKVEPEGFTGEADGTITVDVRQVVHDARTEELVSDSRIRHRYRLEDGVVMRMDVLEASGQP